MAENVNGTGIADEISLDNMRQTLKTFSKLTRNTGNEDGEASVRYIEEYLKRYGVPFTTLKYNCFRSLPVSASLEVVGCGKTYEAFAAVFSGDADKLKGEVYYDHLSLKEPLSDIENTERMKNFKDKIVLSYSRNGEFAYKAAKAGALAVVNIWPQDEELLHRNTIGTVWGNPTTQNIHLHTYIPFLGINNKSGKELIKLYEGGGLEFVLDIKMDRRIVESSMPAAEIKGKSSKYVLVSGHYDAWYEGITDNATANAAMLEIARITNAHQSELKRGIKVIFWSGHSDGRYAGSSWYVDNHWEDLEKNCVAHINLDLLGGLSNDFIIGSSSCTESANLLGSIIEEFTGVNSRGERGLSRAGDESFSSVGVPLSVLSSFRADPNGKYAQWANIYAPWWHTKEDSLDKVNDEYFLRESKYYAKLAWEVLQSDRLPVDPINFIKLMRQKLDALQKGSSAEFDVLPVMERAEALEKALTQLDTSASRLSGEAYDDIINKILGGMVKLVYTCGNEFTHDPAYAGPSDYHVFRLVQNVTRENTTPETHLMLKTEFTREVVRQRVVMGRLIEEISNIIAKLD